MNIALIVSGGKGTRISSDIPKQFIKINGKEMICHTIEKFELDALIDEIVIVTLKDYVKQMQYLVDVYNYTKVKQIVVGGETRQESVRNGLNATNYFFNDIIAIHDGDRPMVSEDLIDKTIVAANNIGACTPALPIKAGFPQGTSGAGRKTTIDKIEYNIQTPQAFSYMEIKDAHNRLKDKSFSDDVSLFEELNKPVKIIEGEFENIKITTDADLKYFIDKKK